MDREQRNFKMDNTKALLIFLVVFGHFLELFKGDISAFLSLLIYSFHMPAFAFCSGYFAKWNPRHLIQRILYPYVCFQVLYLLFGKFFLGDPFSHPFTRPYWLMWYLMSLFFWYLLLPVIDRYQHFRLWFITGAVALALLIGFVPWAGYRFSFSRTVVLFPFFLTGYLCRNVWESSLQALKKRGSMAGSLLCLVMLGCILLLWSNRLSIKPEWLYHSTSYALGGYSIRIRGLLLLNAGIWTSWLLFYLPGRRIPIVSALGRHTMAVYLLHGFFLKLAKANGLLSGSQAVNLTASFLLSLLLCLLLGNPMTERLFHFLFSAEWQKH
ncbi:acyltransferase family protein [Clostridium sp. Marseille-P2415]|uniref:acyltransferase family protein n=1 Tax=Clostridium sp. Marseille-P2415 TaxID=1805471 RepID=UPI0009886C3A|nr:acyltransferase family protein [Clostridium sp. Marseille-P2415]